MGEEHLTETDIERHYQNDVRLDDRMPELVRWWTWSRNVSLHGRADVNQGFGWLVTVALDDEAALQAYLVHPKHVELKELQKLLLKEIIVLDTVSEAIPMVTADRAPKGILMGEGVIAGVL